MQDPLRLVNYYENQVGGSLPGFAGSPVMYGRGIGSVFSRLFRFISPLAKKGFALVRPHLKTAAKGIAGDVFKKAVGKMSGFMDHGAQEGSGGIMVMARKPRKRPPGQRVIAVGKKSRRAGKKKSVRRSHAKRRRSAESSTDIF